jgi:hypothetical protein
VILPVPATANNGYKNDSLCCGMLFFTSFFLLLFTKNNTPPVLVILKMALIASLDVGHTVPMLRSKFSEVIVAYRAL